MLALGAVVLVVGLVGAGALWYASSQRLDDNVAAFARAPSACATTLDFARSGEFTLYVETTGRLDDLAGDCSADIEYDRDELADADVQLVDPDGAAIDISDGSALSYDTGAFTGSSVGVVRIETPGEHVMTVAADGDQFAIAVGGDPNDGSESAALECGGRGDRGARRRRRPAHGRQQQAAPGGDIGRLGLGAAGNCAHVAHRPARVPRSAADDRCDRTGRPTDRTSISTGCATRADAVALGATVGQ